MHFLFSSLSRPAMLKALALAAAALTAPLQPAEPFSAAAFSGGGVGSNRADLTVLPLRPTRGAFATEYFLDGQRFRAIVDTGSPFLLVDGSCATPGAPNGWGCYDTKFSEGSLKDFSEEGYGGQDVGVEWLRGQVRFPSLRAGRGSGDLTFDPITFGVVRTYKAKGGSGAIYMGLVKDRQPRIRPSLLEQTDVQSLRFDFAGSTAAAAAAPPAAISRGILDGYGRSLTLSRRPLIPRGARDQTVPLVDLRPFGAPLASFAAVVHRLVINGKTVPLKRPAVAVIDTGTTGFSISDTLYESPDELPLTGAAMRDITVELLTESGHVLSLAASSRRTPSPATASSKAAAPPLLFDPDFPLVVTSVNVPWFEAQADYTSAKQRATAAENRAAAFGSSVGPHVLFVGLAFLSRSVLTIDTDTLRMSVVKTKTAK